MVPTSHRASKMNDMSVRGAGVSANPQINQVNQPDELKFQLKDVSASTGAKPDQEVDKTSRESSEYQFESKPAKLVDRGGLLNKPRYGSADDAKFN